MNNLCPRHSYDLLSMIKRKGMERHITQHTADVRRKTLLWLRGQSQPQDFDPYIVSSLEIIKKARDEYGAAHNGGCPLCYVEHLLGAADAWIDNVTDLMVVTCHANGLRVGD